METNHFFVEYYNGGIDDERLGLHHDGKIKDCLEYASNKDEWEI